MPVTAEVLDNPQHAGRENIAAFGQDGWQLDTQEAQSLPYRNAALQQEGADLVDDGSALADQALTYAVQACRSSCSTLLVATNFMVGRCTASAIAFAGITRVVIKRLQLATEVMRTDAGLHADQA